MKGGAEMKRTKIKILSLLCAAAVIFTAFSVSASAKAVLQGDIDGNGAVNAADARDILRLSVGISPMTAAVKTLADIDGDGTVSAGDARLALRLAAGLTDVKKTRATVEKNTEYTEKGFVIEHIDGKTYIDGVLIANKTYSLPESYNPGGLLPECKDAFALMQRDAAAKGLNIYISSGFRSYASQKSIYNRYVSRDGRALADTYSARPGHSEHQTGLAIDLNTITQSFGKTREGRWVAEHCHEYGFIIRYPEGKSHITGYCFEPWHLRYVGIDAATEIARSGLCLEEYYGITSFYSE